MTAVLLMELTFYTSKQVDNTIFNKYKYNYYIYSKMSGLFSNHPPHDREMFLSAYNTIQTLEAWEILKNHEPYKGFAVESNPEIVNIIEEINRNYGYNHSGCSISVTMRVMHNIAKNEEYK